MWFCRFRVMRRYFPIFIGLRYFCSNNRQKFISFIVLASLLGIALGVCVLVTVLSVMNGFNEEIENSIFKKAPHVLITNVNFNTKAVDKISKELSSQEIVGVAPYILEHALIKSGDVLKPIFLHGVDMDKESSVVNMKDNLRGNSDDLHAGSYNIFISEKLAEELYLEMGDKVSIMIPAVKFSPLGLIPRYKRFTVKGFLQSSNSLGSEHSYAVVSLSDAQNLYQYGDRITGIRLKTSTLSHAPVTANVLRAKLPSDYHITDWTERYGSHFHAVKLEKMMMLLILSLLIVIAVFNLVSSLVMIVNEKTADIAILRTMGARSRSVLAIFFVQGCSVGFVGTVLGLVFGVILSYNVSSVIDLLLRLTDLDGLLAAVYRVDHFPSKILFNDLLLVGLVSMVLSIIATIYPAWSAARLNPVESLKYE